MIVLAGDVFDSQMDLPDPAVYEIRLWIREFLSMCKEYDIIVVVLEGTPLHDWKQSRLFTHINELASIGADVRYYEYLTIDYFETLDMHILFVPDEESDRCDITQTKVVELLQQHNLEKVDLAVMHGAFPHQMPKAIHARLNLHSPDFYLSITRYLIFVGHVHTHSQYERILAAGSFDRLKHSEEEAKGHLRATVRASGHHDIRFVENKNAQRYVTIRCTGLDAKETLEKIERNIRKLPKGSFVRLLCKRDDAGNAMLKDLSIRFMQFTWTFKMDGKNATEDAIILTDNRNEVPKIRVNRENIKDLLMARIRQKHPDVSDRAQRLLEDLVHE